MTRLHFVRAARKPIPSADIAVGDSYYWWKFRFGGKRVSKTRPPRSALTQSDFLSWLWDLEDNTINTLPADDSLESAVDDLIGEIDSQRDELESRLDNMPDALRDSSDSGNVLQERIDALDNWSSELQSINWDVDKDTIREQNEQEPDEDDAAYEERVETLLQEAWDEKLAEVQGIDHGL